MARLPTEPEAFAEQVARILQKLQPDKVIDLVGPGELIVDGRRLDLENLMRLVVHDEDRGTEIVERYLDQLFNGVAGSMSNVTFDFAQPRIMPRIQPESIFHHLDREQVAHVPFMNDCVVVFVIDMPQMTVSVTAEQMVRWGVTADELEELARQNLKNYTPGVEMQLIESKEGARAAIIAEHDGYDAARLLMPNLHARLVAQLGDDFFVAIPARDMFLAYSNGPESFLGRLRERIEEDHGRLPYPISSAAFLVTRDGIAGTSEKGPAELGRNKPLDGVVAEVCARLSGRDEM